MTRRYYPNTRVDSCAAAGYPFDRSTQDHYFIARCRNCPEWLVKNPQAPFAACRTACRHAKTYSGHESYVIDLERLMIIRRYRFDAIPGTNGPSDDPPY